jgi:pyruvate ferredoxin oxidoreductase gamma subunit
MLNYSKLLYLIQLFIDKNKFFCHKFLFCWRQIFGLPAQFKGNLFVKSGQHTLKEIEIMIEIRIHGRGGQGNVRAAELLAIAAFKDGKFAQAFPAFGAERMGAPVQAFVRIDDKRIRLREQIRKPDYLIIQDEMLMDTVPVLDGLKSNGAILVNSNRTPEELRLNTKARVDTIPATEIAMEIIGRPIPNAIMIGAFCAISGLVSLEAAQAAIMEIFPGRIGENNVAALERANEIIQKRKNHVETD